MKDMNDEETITGSEEKTDDYEVGYGKPPKSGQFTKGVSGNPKGRPKKPLDFDHELIRESESSVIINENGKRRRISKHGVVVKQMMKQAMTGSAQAQRTYFSLRQQASEKAALLATARATDLERCNDVNNLTDEELVRMIRRLELEENKGHISDGD
jgi:hypothetical protein